MGPEGAELHRAHDHGKDQSYFLFATTREQLDYLRFPLGSFSKSETRSLAVKFGLNVASKPDSQDICFVPTGKYTDVIEKIRPLSGIAGNIVHLNGQVLGKHRGIMYYTIGQRRGLGLPDGSGEDPLFVIKIDQNTNQVIVGPREALKRKKIWLEDINWLGKGEYNKNLDGFQLRVKVRSTRSPVPATFLLEGDEIIVELDQPDEGISPGQACVFYSSEISAKRTLGGGWIVKTK
jgi:tRNA-specific 2-thiouridylase